MALDGVNVVIVAVEHSKQKKSREHHDNLIGRKDIG